MYLQHSGLIYKLLILLELQLNVLLLRSQLVLTVLIVNHLMFYNCVSINVRLISNPFFVTKLLDIILVPQYLYNLIKLFFFKSKRTKISIFKKSWPLLFFIISSLVGCLIIVEYPLIILNNSKIQNKLQYSLLIKSKKRSNNIPISFQLGILKIKLLEYLILFRWKN
jgi:hypothetical protein